MKITIESTSRLVELNGIPARIWEGTTEGGIPVVAFISRVAPDIEDPSPEQCAEFERDLATTRVPTSKLSTFIPTRLVL